VKQPGQMTNLSKPKEQGAGLILLVEIGTHDYQACP